MVDSDGNQCTAKVTAKKTGKNEYEYYSCLICDDYQTEGEACEYDENNNITAETKNYRVEIDNDEITGNYTIDEDGVYIVHQGDEFQLPKGKVYYKQNETEVLLDELATPTPKNVDTNKLGTTKVKYVYKGATAKITVKVIDVVSPDVPQVVLKYNNKNGKVYRRDWYSGNIYQEFESTDYSKVGIVGSGIARYEISADGVNFEAISGNSRTSTENGNYNFYVRSVDKSGNISDMNIYNIKIDKEIPQCKLVSSGTTGNTGWYIGDATIAFESTTETVSSIKQ